MKCPVNWLREWLDCELDSSLSEQLSMAGLEATESAPEELSTAVVCARIVEVKAHPEADKLTVCTVNDGGGEHRVVCGAPNVAVGKLVPYAPPGCQLPGGNTLEVRTIRGIESQGMLCAADELGLDYSEEEGLLELPDQWQAGTVLAKALGLDDRVVELDLTPNRGDCLSMLGLARETAVINGRNANDYPQYQDDEIDTGLEGPDVSLAAAADCPRYLARRFRGLSSGMKSPLWLRERLRKAGYRSGNAIVDITNYVMLELGQPLHAFDAASLQGELSVRRARADEKLLLIDGSESTLTPRDLLICDADQPVALAGVMGGQNSAVSDSTTELILECAWFAPAVIAGRARHHRLNSEAARRFERGVDPLLTELALKRATALLLEYCGGSAGPITVAEEPQYLPQKRRIDFRPRRIQQLLGISPEVLAPEQAKILLQQLGMQVEEQDRTWLVTVPSWRSDLEQEADLLEEIARLHGYNRLPPARCRFFGQTAAPPRHQADPEQLAQRLAARGYREVISYSMVADSEQQMLAPEAPGLKLSNPLNSEMEVLRSGLWQGLLGVLRYNAGRQLDELKIFETGRCFEAAPERPRPLEWERLGMLRTGGRDPLQWEGPATATDFYDIKGDVSNLLAFSGRSWQFTARSDHPALHPGQAADIRAADSGKIIGSIGMLHPALQQKLKLRRPVALAELSLEALSEGTSQPLNPLSNQPSLCFDLGLVVEHRFPAAEIEQALKESVENFARHYFKGLDRDFQIIENIKLFDVYSGAEIGDGQRCLSYRLTLRHDSLSLGEEVVSGIISAVSENLGSNFSARLRDTEYKSQNN